MPSSHYKNFQPTISCIAAHSGPLCDRQARRSSAMRSAGLRFGFCNLYRNNNFEPESGGSEIAEQLAVNGSWRGGLQNSALVEQNPKAANSHSTLKILRIQAKNSEKKECVFWAEQPDKFLKTKDIKIFLRKTNPSEPEKSLKTNDIRIY